MSAGELFDVRMYEQGYQILCTDAFVDKLISEEGSSHADGSQHECEPAMSLSGIINKCTICGEIV